LVHDFYDRPIGYQNQGILMKASVPIRYIDKN
jgi:hypothetical protein